FGTNMHCVCLFATNFRAGTIDVFAPNGSAGFRPATSTEIDGAFTDPNMPAGFAPFGIQNIHGDLFVTYAMQDAAKHDDVAGPGNGFVDVYTTRGKMLKRFASGGALNSPWAVTFGVGKDANDILVGNFGDGRINVFNTRGTSLGQLEDTNSQPITIDGLWDVTPGTGKNKRTLFFAAGTNGEADGLFGTLAQHVVTRLRQATPGSPTSGGPY